MADSSRYAVIFDLDGTLIDSLADIGHAMNHCLEVAGAPPRPIDAYRGYIGNGTLTTARRAAPEGADVEAIAEMFKRHYTANYVDRTQLFEGIFEAIDALKADGFPLGVLSNKPDEATRKIIDLLFASGTFQATAGVRVGIPKKPDPTAALQQAAAFGVPPDRTFFIGDTTIDISTACSAGMRAVGVAWGFRPTDELRAAGAELICQTPSELGHLVELWNARPGA